MTMCLFPQQPDGYCSIHYKPERLTQEQRNAGILVDALPAKPAVQPGCFLALKGDKATETAWYENVAYPYDALEESKEAGREEIRAISQTLIDVDSLTDEQLEDALSIYPAWAVGVQYKVKDYCVYADVLYEVLQAHTSQADWYPPNVPALFLRKTPEGTIAEWVQPLGAHDAYPLGAMVLHNSKTWISIYDGANVWEPGVYGWEEVT